MNIQTVFCGDIRENAYIVSLPGREDCAVIDPGDEYPKLRRALGTLRVAAILLTHGHFDHIMAVGEMAREYGAPVYIASADMEMLNDPGLNGRANLMGVNRMGGPEIEALPYDRTIAAAGMEFAVLSTPGHSKGSVCLYEEEEAVLFSGDTLFEGGFGRIDLFGGSGVDMRASLRFLFTLPPETRVYPGHGGATTIGAEKARYRL